MHLHLLNLSVISDFKLKIVWRGEAGLPFSTELLTVITQLAFRLPDSPSFCFLENFFTVSKFSLIGGIILRSNSGLIISVTYIYNLKVALEVRSFLSPLPQKPPVRGIEVVSEEKPQHSGIKLVYDKGKILLSLPAASSGSSNIWC